jgi:hypothetical protein
MKKFLLLILSILLFIVPLVLAHGCITIVEPQPSDESITPPADLTPSHNESPQLSPEIVVTFTAAPSNIVSGHAAKLSWNCTGATTVIIDQGIGSVGLSGELLVSPSTTTIYILTASNAQNSVTASTQVIVAAASSPAQPTSLSSFPVIHVFTAEPESITEGESSTITWSVSDASSVNIDPVVYRQMDSMPADGSAPVTPSVTTIYTLTAMNAAGMSSDTVIVTVNPATAVYKDWTGTWDTNWGTMVLTQSAGTVTGTYTHDDGKITGGISKNLSGNILVGTWSEEPTYKPYRDAGDIEFIMAPDRDSFTGKWRYGFADNWNDDWDGSWVATRISTKLFIGD